MAIGETTNSPNDQHHHTNTTIKSEKANLETHTQTHTIKQRAPKPAGCVHSRAAAAHTPSSQLGRTAGPALISQASSAYHSARARCHGNNVQVQVSNPQAIDIQVGDDKPVPVDVDPKAPLDVKIGL